MKLLRINYLLMPLLIIISMSSSGFVLYMGSEALDRVGKGELKYQSNPITRPLTDAISDTEKLALNSDEEESIRLLQIIIRFAVGAIVFLTLSFSAIIYYFVRQSTAHRGDLKSKEANTQLIYKDIIDSIQDTTLKFENIIRENLQSELERQRLTVQEIGIRKGNADRLKTLIDKVETYKNELSSIRTKLTIISTHLKLPIGDE